MRNKFASKCSRCSLPVAAGDGSTERVGSRWITSHDKCPQLPSGRRADEFMQSQYGWGGTGEGLYGEYTGYGHDFGPDECNPNEGSKG